MQTTSFDPHLIQRFDRQGPEYTTYPAVDQFYPGFNVADYRQQVQASNDELIPRPLSLYIHIPFCDSLCYYCSCNKKVSQHSEQAVPYLAALHREIQLQSELFDDDRKVVQLYFGGGTPTYLSNTQLSRLMSRLGEHFNLPAKKKREWSIEVDPRTVNLARIDLLADLGFNYLNLGVQDFDAQVQKAVNRIHQPEHTDQLISRAREQGFDSISIDLIYGLPHQTPESFISTVDTVMQMRPDRLSIYNYTHKPKLFPSQQLIHSRDLPSPETKLSMLGDTVERLLRAGYRHIGMFHFALETDSLSIAQDKGRLQRNLQGYSTKAQCELLGLGVSAIGQVGNCYSQNHKDISAYQAALENQTLAISRGIILREEDRLRRAIIQQIMCQHRVEFAALSYKYHLDFKHHFAVEMELLEQLTVDGLIEIDALSLSITPPGQMLLRSIAMIFDQYLHRNESSKRFSSML